MKINRKIIIIGLFFIFLISSFSQTISFSLNENLFQNLYKNEEVTVLISGFGPFDIYDINPSQLIVEELNEIR